MKPRTDRQRLIEKLDAITRRIVKDRDDGKCQFLSCMEPGTEVHHIFSRRHLSVRWDQDNLILLCPDCHKYAHSHPEEFQAQLWLEMGFIFDGLHQKANVVVHYKNADLLEILEGLKNK